MIGGLRRISCWWKNVSLLGDLEDATSDWFSEGDDRNSYCIFNIILVIIYSALDQLQDKILEKQTLCQKRL
jgi:hypothetical protein